MDGLPLLRRSSSEVLRNGKLKLKNLGNELKSRGMVAGRTVQCSLRLLKGSKEKNLNKRTSKTISFLTESVTVGSFFHSGVLSNTPESSPSTCVMFDMP